jgi:hypothetical protein
MRLIQALYEEAAGGNVKALEKLQDLIGETVQREELTMKKKQAAAQSKPDNGKTADLIAGMQEAADDLHEETAAVAGAVETEEPMPD